VSEWLTARGGIDAHADLVRLVASVPRAGDDGALPPVFAAYPSVRTSLETTVYNPAVYALLEGRFGPVRVAPGLRVDHFSRPGQLGGTTVVQPRCDVGWDVTESTSLRAAAGFYSRYADVWEYAEGVGNPRLEPERSWQYSAGIEQRWGRALSLDVVGFYRSLDKQVSTVDDPEVRFDNGGKGRSYGTEMLLKLDPRDRFHGWVGYTLSRSERRESGDREYHLYAFDQTHNLTAVGQYRLNSNWEFGARFRYVSGNPVTPVVGATYDSDADVYVPIGGAPYSTRLGAFHQLDVRVDRHWAFESWKLTAYVDVQNVYGRENPGTVSYNYDYSESKAAADPLSIPFVFPSFGVKGEF
jgi:outer membrane receptor protein involved in Fe transport